MPRRAVRAAPPAWISRKPIAFGRARVFLATRSAVPAPGLTRAACLAWLEEQEPTGPRFDLIFVDPPTFSNAKRMDGVLDVQRDHVGMIRRSWQLLRPSGRLVFSTNYTRFKLDAEALADLRVEDISAQPFPKDFDRNARTHRCFTIGIKP